jgi:hypothetical protein
MDAEKEQEKAVLKEFWKRYQAQAKHAGQLRKFLEERGWSKDMAEHITEGLQMYRVAQLQYLIEEDLEELGLSAAERRKLLSMASAARDWVASQSGLMPSVLAPSNTYLVGTRSNTSGVSGI